MSSILKSIKKAFKDFKNESKKAINDLKSIKTMKNQIPNLFTFSRLLLVPFIVSNIVAGNLLFAGALTATASLTDCIDGFLARKLNAASEFGRKLDAIIDKIFVVSVALPLAIIQPYLLLPITLDAIIASINGYAHLKGYNPQTSKLGRKKTIFLDALVSSSFFVNISFAKPFIFAFYIATISLQIKAGTEYYNLLLKKLKEKKRTIKLTASISPTDSEQKEISNEETIKLSKKYSKKEILEYYKEKCQEVQNVQAENKIKTIKK